MPMTPTAGAINQQAHRTPCNKCNKAFVPITDGQISVPSILRLGKTHVNFFQVLLIFFFFMECCQPANQPTRQPTNYSLPTRPLAGDDMMYATYA